MLKTLLVWFYKLIEIVAVLLIGYGCYYLATIFVFPALAVGIAFAVGYFFGGLIRPYINELQNWLFKLVFEEQK